MLYDDVHSEITDRGYFLKKHEIILETHSILPISDFEQKYHKIELSLGFYEPSF